MIARRSRLIVEFLVLFAVLPAGAWAVRRFGHVALPVLPGLWAMTAVCLLILWRAGDFEWRRLITWSGLRGAWLGIAARFILAAAILSLAMVLWDPHRIGLFVRNRPGTWLLVMVLYPVLSAWPQTIVYRAFLLHRYRPLAGADRRAAALSATAFAFCHIVLDNIPAVALTLVGGAIFARTYQRTRSAPVSALEHAFYGDFLFTVGMGAYFYHGTTELIRAAGG